MPTTNRIIDITEGPAHLRYTNRLLSIINTQTEKETAVPVNNIGVVVISTPHATITQPAIAALSQAGVCVIFCDGTHLPAAMCLPFGSHHAPANRFRAQADFDGPARKRCWQSIVQSKLDHQAALLRTFHGSDFGLALYSRRVRSGDPENIEGQGARLYWGKLFQNQTTRFTRDQDAGDINALLNYGYAILRAITARAICCAGLHPGIGIHHHHRENSFCLADDLMEPFRTLVDHTVFRITEGGKHRPDALSATLKSSIIKSLLAPIPNQDRNESIFYVIERLAESFAAICEGNGKTLRLPQPVF